ncbi:Mov34/MPN/PAD-1 family protein [uncultured Methanobacterium sp.]|uniref:Mov34/MPN/PAD-1 family protein n=1 Tax=uncultured Methanobacterium sp. TaxID=176306 RepID=UPI002AA7B2AE|nr:Mov34/MPN/PAD-1 family protein [uncultured Methanobacterium sp.]
MLIFKSEDTNLEIILDNPLLKNILEECSKFKDLETGGILIGAYFDNRAIVSEIIGPPADSIHEPCDFYRGTAGLNELLDEKWKQGEFLVGEWHYHPNNSPEPSPIDDATMHEFSQDEKLNCHEIIQIIAGGNESMGWEFSVHLYMNNQKFKFKQQN